MNHAGPAGERIISPRRKPWGRGIPSDEPQHGAKEEPEMAHTFTSLLTHIIFSTKDRLPQIEGELKKRLYPYLGGILKRLDGKASIIDGTCDHVHLLVQLPPDLALSDAMRVLKTNSSKWV